MWFGHSLVQVACKDERLFEVHKEPALIKRRQKLIIWRVANRHAEVRTENGSHAHVVKRGQEQCQLLLPPLRQHSGLIIIGSIWIMSGRGCGLCGVLRTKVGNKHRL